MCLAALFHGRRLLLAAMLLAAVPAIAMLLLATTSTDMGLQAGWMGSPLALATPILAGWLLVGGDPGSVAGAMSCQAGQNVTVPEMLHALLPEAPSFPVKRSLAGALLSASGATHLFDSMTASISRAWHGAGPSGAPGSGAGAFAAPRFLSDPGSPTRPPTIRSTTGPGGGGGPGANGLGAPHLQVPVFVATQAPSDSVVDPRARDPRVPTFSKPVFQAPTLAKPNNT
ncbi:hypothetical protein H696_00201 [Fonticula alba]|uniref:Uncharacterized protein n=1 Tax=Fonticula alba TaxID=691883 RepID=A0A058ZGJ4_FONAL|nr:hypothetical protein H696_00201 [Fonticula alba]KCV72617.1 hypothetical protein H696_00201 [Fonticula alba]|eukprot:XP_009492318.1 hypothetical protein H696_00201 [Fonticula alba]